MAANWSSRLGLALGWGEKKGWERPTRRGCWSSTAVGLVFGSTAGFLKVSVSADPTLGGRDLVLLDAVLEALRKGQQVSHCTAAATLGSAKWALSACGRQAG